MFFFLNLLKSLMVTSEKASPGDFGSSKSGIDGCVEFFAPKGVTDIINQVVKAGQCLLYCLNHWALLDEVPIPHQILVTMKGSISKELNTANILRKYFSQHGTVTGIISLGFALTTDRFLYKHSYIIGFREREMVKKMIGSNVEIMRYSGYIMEVTKENFYSSFVPSPHHILWYLTLIASFSQFDTTMLMFNLLSLTIPSFQKKVQKGSTSSLTLMCAMVIWSVLDKRYYYVWSM